jgi:hypothetical protein
LQRRIFDGDPKPGNSTAPVLSKIVNPRRRRGLVQPAAAMAELTFERRCGRREQPLQNGSADRLRVNLVDTDFSGSVRSIVGLFLPDFV